MKKKTEKNIGVEIRERKVTLWKVEKRGQKCIGKRLLVTHRRRRSEMEVRKADILAL
jgi:hypothetical protein